MRARRSVCEKGHAIVIGKGRTRPDYVWASGELDKSLGKGHRAPRTVPSLVKFIGSMARPRPHTQFQVRIDGGNLRSKGSVQSGFQIHIEFFKQASEGLDTFAAPSRLYLKFCPGPSQQKGL